MTRCQPYCSACVSMDADRKTLADRQNRTAKVVEDAMSRLYMLAHPSLVLEYDTSPVNIFLTHRLRHADAMTDNHTA